MCVYDRKISFNVTPQARAAGQHEAYENKTPHNNYSMLFISQSIVCDAIGLSGAI